MTERQKLLNAFIDHIGDETVIYLDEHVKDVERFIEKFLNEYDRGSW